MQRIQLGKNRCSVSDNSIITIGMFDGVHRGHKKILKRVIGIAHKNKVCSVVITFDPHPRKLLRQKTSPLLLTSLQHKIDIMKSVGIDQCYVLDFDNRIAQLDPTRFITQLWELFRFRGIVIGTGFRFGFNARGESGLLKKIGEKMDFFVKEVPPLYYKETVVSSTLVRQMINEGNLFRVKQYLGRDFSILGTVVSGKNIGKQLGYPTVNIDPHQEILPPAGVYIGSAYIHKTRFFGMINVGFCPTFVSNRRRLSIEVYFFAFNQSLYDKDIEVYFHKKIREEKKFDSGDLLVKQIRKDEIFAKKYIKRYLLK
ncbi:bifunctional riboflavin kinase/FAD synthetase [Chlamydiota bacterium]